MMFYKQSDCLHSMWSRVYEMVKRQSTAAAVCGGFAAEHRAGRYRSTVAGAGAQQQ